MRMIAERQHRLQHHRNGSICPSAFDGTKPRTAAAETAKTRRMTSAVTGLL